VVIAGSNLKIHLCLGFRSRSGCTWVRSHLLLCKGHLLLQRPVRSCLQPLYPPIVGVGPLLLIMFVGLLSLGLYLLPGQVTRPRLVRIGFGLLLLPLPLLGVGPTTAVHGVLPAAVPAFMPSSLLAAMPPPPPAADAPVSSLLLQRSGEIRISGNRADPLAPPHPRKGKANHARDYLVI
jgi:hypothetical protein